MLLKSLLVGAGLSGAVPALAVANLVDNGSFERGLAGWRVGGTDLQAQPPVAITYGAAAAYPNGAYGEAVPVDSSNSASPDAAGQRGAYFVSDFARGQSLIQDVYLAVGSYRVGFSAYAPGNGYKNIGDALFTAAIAGVQLANYAVSEGPRQLWQDFSGTATITRAGVYNVGFWFDTNRSPSKDIVIDRVYVVEDEQPGEKIPEDAVVSGVPEPQTRITLILGFGLAGYGLRRQSASARA
jgi:hypothetical protein